MKIKERGFGKMKIGNKERGFHIGTYQSKVFCDVRNIKLDEYLNELSTFSFENNLANNLFICHLLYSALVAYCTFHDELVEFTPDKVMFWADAAEPAEIAKLFEAMAEMKRSTPKKSKA